MQSPFEFCNPPYRQGKKGIDMLDNYFRNGMSMTDKKTQRLLAVQAALEIAKNSVGSTGGAAHSRVDQDLESVTEKVEALADAIQAALSKNID